MIFAASEAIAYERSLFSPTEGNWPDLRSFARSSRKPSYMTSWCHGAPGIGLARLGSLAIFDTPQIREEIAVALNTTLQFGLQDIDHPCCGNCGSNLPRDIYNPGFFQGTAGIGYELLRLLYPSTLPSVLLWE